jgi:hypothetical protein
MQFAPRHAPSNHPSIPSSVLSFFPFTPSNQLNFLKHAYITPSFISRQTYLLQRQNKSPTFSREVILPPLPPPPAMHAHHSLSHSIHPWLPSFPSRLCSSSICICNLSTRPTCSSLGPHLFVVKLCIHSTGQLSEANNLPPLRLSSLIIIIEQYEQLLPACLLLS